MRRFIIWARALDWYAFGALVLGTLSLPLAVGLLLFAPAFTLAAVVLALFAVVLAVLSLRS